MNNIPPEVLIYIQTIKTHFHKNEKMFDYFLKDSDENLFFEHLSVISQKNFEESGEVMLTRDQFEVLNKTIKAIVISKINYNESSITEKENTIFFDIPNFGQVCLN